MRRSSLFVIVSALVFSIFHAGVLASPSRPYLPLVEGKPVVALINGEPLTLEEFDRQLADIHGGMTDNATKSLTDPSQLLDRLINAKLVLQEARRIGLDELPEVRSAVKTNEEDTLRGMLYGYHVRNIRKPDRKEVEKRYRRAVKEVKVASVLFGKEGNAKRMEEEIKGGGNFGILAKKVIDAEEAKGSPEGQYLKFESLSPEVAKVVSSMKKGEVSPLIAVGKQFSLVRLEDIRFPKDEAARKQAGKDALQAKRTAALNAYTEKLRKKYARIDRKLANALDFESAEPGFEKLLADERVVAKVKGGKPVTVGDLATTLQKKFFHGVEKAAEEKKINSRKDLALEEILNRRVSLTEAGKRKLNRTDYFKEKTGEYRDGILFGAFVQKVIAPDVKVGEEELNGYYQSHIGEYMYSEMVRIDSLAFSARGNAEDALVKLRGGADFLWLRANAEDQVDPAKVEALQEFEGQLLSSATLPEEVRKAISGAAQGEYRLHAEPGKAYYVLGLRERIPPRPMPLESVRGEIGEKLYREKIRSVLRDWEEKLRKASDVKIYATGEKLYRFVDPRVR